MTSTPMYFPSAFDMKDAKTCTDLVQVGYQMYAQWTRQNKPRHQDNFHWQAPVGTELSYSAPIWSKEKLFHFLRESEPFGFVARAADGDAHLVFRGTDSLDDWIENAQLEQTDYGLVPGYGKVHKGFHSLYRSMRDEVHAQLAALGSINRLWVTGHSLGSGLSTLAVPDLLQAGVSPQLLHYNLASPRVGDSDFAAAYNSNGAPTYRIVNTCDLVPEIPPAVLDSKGCLYQHIGTPVCFTAQYGSLSGNHSLMDAYDYALDHPEAPQGSSG